MVKNKIILVPFPFDDLKQVKVRPALALTNKIGEFNHVVIAFISSHIPDVKLETDIILRHVDKDFKFTGLKVDSVIRLHRIVTIPADLIKRELGSLPKKLQEEIDKKIKLLFEIL
jgi:mRNA interferase MazF